MLENDYFMSKYLLMICLTVASLACKAEDADKAQIQKTVVNYLINKDSTKFGAYTRVNSVAACVGMRTATTDGQSLVDVEATVVRVKGVWKVMEIRKMAHEECVKIMSELTARQAQLES